MSPNTLHNDGEIAVQLAALESLETYDLDPEPTISVIKAVLKSNEAKLRSAAIRCLVKIRVRTDEVIELILLVLTNDTEATVRESAARSLPIATKGYLEQYGNEAAGTTNRLLKRVSNALSKTATDDPGAPVRVAALKSLADVLTEDVLTEDVKTVSTNVVPFLLTAGKDVEPSVRETAAVTLATIAAGDGAARAKLMELTRDSDAEVRRSAIDSFTYLPKHVDLVLPVIVRGLQDRSADVRKTAISKLNYFLTDGIVHPPIVGVHLGVGDEAFTEHGAGSKGILVTDIVAKSPAQVAGLAKNDVILLVDGEQISDSIRFRQIVKQHTANRPLALTVRRGTQQMLVSVTPGPATPGLMEVIPLLINLCDDREIWTRANSLATLAIIGFIPDTAIEELIQKLDDEESYVVEQAVNVAITFGDTHADKIIPKGLQLLEHEEPEVRCAAANMLSHFGTAAQVAIPKLSECLRDKEPEVRGAAAVALTKLVNPADHAKIAGLTEALSTVAATERKRTKFATLYGAVTEGSRLLKEGKAEEAAKQGQTAFAELSPDTPEILHAATLELLVDAHSAMRQFNESRDYCQQLLNWKIGKYGSEDAEVGRTQHRLAVVYGSFGQYSQAEALFRQSLDVLERSLGVEHQELAPTLHNLSQLLARSGQLGDAEKLALRALEIQRKQLPADHPDLAISIGTVAQFLSLRGEHGKAEGMFLDALKSYRAAKEKDDDQVARMLYGLGSLCLLRGDHQAAIPRLEEARAIITLPPGDPDLKGLILQSLVAAYSATGKQDQAAAVSRQMAIDAFRPSGASKSSWLYFKLRGFQDSAWLGDWANDLALLDFAEQVGEDAPVYAIAQKIVAEARLRVGNYDSSERLFWESISRLATFAPDHPQIASALQELGVLNIYRGNWFEAMDNHHRSRKIVAEYVHQNLPFLSEPEQHLFLQQANGEWLARGLSSAITKLDDTAACEMSVEWLFNSKAIALTAIQERTELAEQSNVPEIQQLRGELRDIRERLAYLVTTIDQGYDIAGVRKEVEDLSTRERELSKQLSMRLGTQTTAASWVTLGAIREVLPADTVLIELARFPRFTFEKKHEELNAEQLPEAHFAAWLVPAAGQGSVRLIPLGPASQIEAAVKEVRDAMAAAPGDVARLGEVESEANARKVLQKASRLLLEPLKPHLAGMSRLLICPDASLWLLPWESLLLDDQYAVEQFKISYLVSSRELLRSNLDASTDESLVLADPNFSLARTRIPSLVMDVLEEAPGKSTVSARQSGLGSMKWAGLPGTALEAEAIAPLLKRYCGKTPSVYLQDRALETIVKAAQHPRTLVLSTHGFFLEEQLLAKDETSASKPTRGIQLLPAQELPLGLARQTSPVNDNPLLRCGLVFAGANAEGLTDDSAGPGDDGILTGLEIIGLDLRGTELVSLSACETSVGKIQNGEGVASLRQAFHLAGAQNVLASAWKIPDKETATLMSAYFRNLADGSDRVTALRSAQLRMMEDRRQQSNAAHPYFWAAFTVTGCPQDLLVAANVTLANLLESQASPICETSFLRHIDFAIRHFGAQSTNDALSAMNPTQRKALEEHLVATPDRLSLGISYAIIRSNPEFVFQIVSLPPREFTNQQRRQALTNILTSSDAESADFRRALADRCDRLRSILAKVRAEAAPNTVAAYNARAFAYGELGLHVMALKDREAIIKLTPESASAYNGAAWYLATCSAEDARDGKKAVQYGTVACELTQWKNVLYLDTLAAAYAEAGDFKNAIAWQQKACDSIERFSPRDRDQVQKRLKLYQSSQPYRE